MIRAIVAGWLASAVASLRQCARESSQRRMSMMNPLNTDDARVPPLVTRPFSFTECLHTPPMLASYTDESDAPA